MSTISDVIGAVRANPSPPYRTYPDETRSFIAGPADSAEVQQAWDYRDLASDATELWNAARTAQLFHGVKDKQWGLTLLDPVSAARRTLQEWRARPEEFAIDDLVLGEFLGDSDVVVLAPSEVGPRRVLIALPLDEREHWYAVGRSLAEFLADYVAQYGDKYWERPLCRVCGERAEVEIPRPGGGVLHYCEAHDPRLPRGAALSTSAVMPDTIGADSAKGDTGDRVLLASAGDDTVRFWDPSSCQPYGTPLHHPAGVIAVSALSLHDRVLLASAGDDGDIHIWELGAGQPVDTPLHGNIGPVLDVSAFEHGHRTLLASTSSDKTVRIWDPESGELYRDPLEHAAPVLNICLFRHQGQTMLAAACRDRTIRLWGVSSGRAYGVPLRHAADLLRVHAFDHDGRTLLASAGDEEVIRVWDPAACAVDGEPLRGHTGAVWALCSTEHDGRKLLVSGGDDQSVRTWDPTSRQPYGEPFYGHTESVWGLTAFSDDHRDRVASAGRRWNSAYLGPSHGTPVRGFSSWPHRGGLRYRRICYAAMTRWRGARSTTGDHTAESTGVSYLGPKGWLP